MNRKTVIALSAITMATITTVAPDLVMAAKMNVPSYVDTPDASSLESAGETINQWIFAGMAIIVAAFSARPGYLFITGQAEEGWKSAKNILIGVVVALVMGGIAFSVANSVGS